ncbi:MAG: Aquaporin Z [Planctomycetes bacterium]|nr:Aquaporin Z [Planctomycetota bacterium]
MGGGDIRTDAGTLPPLARRAAAEGVATALLLAAVVRSGIMGERLSDSAGLALLANSLATGAALVALILAFGPVSGAHMNPAVTLVEAVRGRLSWREAAAYVPCQVAGAFAGVAAAHAMFGLAVFAASPKARADGALVFSEVVATFGLVLTVLLVVRSRPAAAPWAVAAYVTGAYWFTSSTSFANPAVTAARSFTPTFAGIRPADAPAFVGAQLAGAACALAAFRLIAGREAPR